MKLFQIILVLSSFLLLNNCVGITPEKVNINKMGKQINYIDMINNNFENILISNDTILEEKLEMRINEIRKTITL